MPTQKALSQSVDANGSGMQHAPAHCWQAFCGMQIWQSLRTRPLSSEAHCKHPAPPVIAVDVCCGPCASAAVACAATDLVKKWVMFSSLCACCFWHANAQTERSAVF
eukprot:1493153-Amphidinium_carterae.2